MELKINEVVGEPAIGTAIIISMRNDLYIYEGSKVEKIAIKNAEPLLNTYKMRGVKLIFKVNKQWMSAPNRPLIERLSEGYIITNHNIDPMENLQEYQLAVMTYVHRGRKNVTVTKL